MTHHANTLLISRRYAIAVVLWFGVLGCSNDNDWMPAGGDGESCDVHDDCPVGLGCIDGVCHVIEDGGADTGPEPGVCPVELQCGGDCCETGEVCEGAACLPPCDSGVRCGLERECCGDEELCLDDACIVPGDSCVESIDCPDDFFCDSSLERCLPRSTGRCEYYPPTAQFDPQEEWAWTGSEVVGASVHVMMAPAVGDLDGDGVPEVVFNTYNAAEGYQATGVLRIARGDTGSEVASITSPVVCPMAGIALGDLDADGVPEIVTAGPCAGPLLAFHMDGELLWQSHTEDGSIHNVDMDFGAPSIADLDGDGFAEIVVAGTVFEHDGTLRWANDAYAGANCCGADQPPTSPVTAVYNVDGDGDDGLGTLEVVSGNAVWRPDGSTLWERPEAQDGYVAVADFFDDGAPDIVVVHAGYVSIRAGIDGRDLWGPVLLPGGGRGGPPTVADFDADGLPEIGVAGSTQYAVFDPDGERPVSWTYYTEDDSSNITGSSVFDFDGDGSAEVVYNDECYMRVFSGFDGTILATVPQHSHTLIEYPLIVDVDADGNAEIVFAANAAVQACSSSGSAGYDGDRAGIRVFGDAMDNWVGTRRVWNQHTYHVMNIREDLSIPSNERPNWLFFNSFRQNPQNYDAPDITPSELSVNAVTCPPAILETVVENLGAATVGAGLAVSFYLGTPDGVQELIDTVRTTEPIPPRGSAIVQASFEPTPEQQNETLDYFVRVDDAGDGVGEQNECVESNNVATGELRCSIIE